MRATKKLIVSSVVLLILLQFSYSKVNAQGCLGADGVSGIGGGVARFQNGATCVNVDNAAPNTAAKGAILRVTATNVAVGDLVEANITWNDGSPATGWFPLTNLGAGLHEVNSAKHFFPSVNTNCEYTPTTQLRVNGVLCNANFGISPVFFRWNIEGAANSPSSAFVVTNTVTPMLTVIEVCAGSTTTVSFTDRSNLNCNTSPGDVSVSGNLNNRRRWRQFVYGGAGALNTITGGVIVDVTPVPIGTGFNGDIVTPAITTGAPAGPGGGDDTPTFLATYVNPPAPQQSLNITVPATAQVNEEFVITTRYWNACNRYDQGEAPVEYNLSRIRIVAQPTPPTATNQAVCQATGINPFSVTGVPANATVNFYRNANGAPGVPLGTDNTSPYQLPVANYVAGAGDSIETGTPGIYKVWASYTPQVVGVSPACETRKIPVTIIIRPTIATPAAITGPNEVCNDNLTQYDFSEAANSPTPTPNPAWVPNLVGGTTIYTWNWNDNTGISAIAPTGATNKNLDDVVFNIAVGTFGAAPSLTRTLNVNSRYTTGTPVCTTPNTQLPVTVYRQSAAGSIAPATATLCAGESTGTLTLSGHRGSILRWERIFNGGSVENIANTTATYSETLPYGAGTYEYRAVIRNGVCNTVTSASSIITVNPVPVKPTISQGAGSNGLTICQGQQTVLQSSNVGGLAAIYQWFKTTDLVTPVQATASNTITLTTLAQSGDYVVRVVGVAPSNCPSPFSDPVTVTIRNLPAVVDVRGGGAACDGNPAPNIIFEFSGGAPYTFTIDVPPAGAGPEDITPPPHPSNIFTLTGQTIPGNYSISALTNGCIATTLGGSASVISSGGSPVLDAAPRALNPNQGCSAGVSTVNPTLQFSLQNSAVNGYILTYSIDGVDHTRTFNTDANGDPSPAIVLNAVPADDALNAVGPHTVRIVSIESPTGCLGVFNVDLTFTVHPLPTAPVSNGNVLACASNIATTSISVTDPDGAGPITVDWYAAASGGGALLSGNNTFTPGAAGTYYAESRNATTTCISTTRTAVTLNSEAVPTNIGAGGNFAVCQTIGGSFGNVAGLSALTPVNGTGTWTSINPSVTFDNATSPTAQARFLPIGVTTLTWTVRSATNACTPIVRTVDVTVNASPTVTDPNPSLCESSNGTLIALSVDLTTYNNIITGGIPDRSVQWVSIADPTNHDVSNGDVINVIVTNTVTLCPSAQFPIDFEVLSQPVANDHTFEFCEVLPAGSNQATGVDLTANAVIDVITGIAGSVGRTVTWHPTLLDAINNTAQVMNANNYDVIGSQTLFVRVSATSGASCVNTAEITLTVKPRPLDPILNGGQAQCVGNIDVYTVSATPGANYIWDIVDNPVTGYDLVFGGGLGGSTSDIYALISFPNVFSSDIGVTAVLNGCASNQVRIPIEVNDTPPVVSIMPSPAGPYCVGQTNVTFTATPIPNNTYTWVIPGTTGTIIATNAAGNQVTVNLSTVDGNIEVTPEAPGGCEGTPATFFIDLNDRPVMATYAVPEICSDSPINIDFATTGVPAATGYKIQNVQVNPQLNPSSRPFNPATVVAFNEIHNDAFTNQTNANLEVRYTVVPVSAASCEGAPRDIIVRIKPEPVLSSTLVATVCSGDASGLGLGVAPGSAFADRFNIVSIDPDGLTSGGGSPTVGPNFLANEISDDIWINTTGAIHEVHYMVEPVNTVSGCTGDAIMVRVIVNPKPLILNTPLTEPICSGDQPTISINPSIPGSSVHWIVKSSTGVIVGGLTSGTSNDITTTLTNTGSTPGTVVFELRATAPGALGGCQGDPVDYTVIVNPAPATSWTVPTICSDVANNGRQHLQDLTALESTISPGPGLTFTWYMDAGLSTLVPTPNAHVLSHNISVFVEVSNGTCAKVQEVKYNINPLPSVDLLRSTIPGTNVEITCNGANNGQITASAQFGTPNYLFSLNGGPFVAATTFSNLGPGSYTVRVQDSAVPSCIAISDPIDIREPVDLAITTKDVVNVLCRNGNNGALTIVGTGGIRSITGNFTFSLNGAPFQADSVFTGLGAGTYSIRVKDDNGCIEFGTQVITQPATVVSGTFTKVDVNCAGFSTGSITMNGAGGTPFAGGQYDYFISTNPSDIVRGVNRTFTGLTVGNYNVTVTDASGCTFSQIINIAEPPALFVPITKTDETCFNAADGTITVTPSGGTPFATTPTLQYEYSLDGGPFILDPDLTTAGYTFTGVASGVHTIEVRDNASPQCTAPASINLIAKPQLFVNETVALHKNVSCFNQTIPDGSITVSTVGGTGVVTFAIRPDPGADPAAGAYQASPTFGGLAAGNYVVYGKDANGCIAQSAVITITQPLQLTAFEVVGSNVMPSCNGGSNGSIDIDVTAGTGTAPYLYNLNANPIVGAPNTQFLPNNGVFTDLAAGNYRVTVRDNNLCTTTVDFTISQPLVVQVDIDQIVDANCFGSNTGSLRATAQGGTPFPGNEYLFSLDGGTFTQFPAVHVFNNLLSGNHTVRVRDANGCPVTPASDTDFVGQPTQVAASNITVTNVSCSGFPNGIIDVTATGGTGTLYRFAIRAIADPQPVFPGGYVTNSPSANHFVINTLLAGTYRIWIADENGCAVFYDRTITEPLPLSVAPVAGQPVNVLCNGQNTGSIVVQAAGGTPGYEYSINGGPFSSSNNFTQLFADVPYTITVRDQTLTCTATYGPFQLTQPLALAADALRVSSNNDALFNGFGVSCANATDGRVTVENIRNGVGPYTVQLVQNPGISGVGVGTAPFTAFTFSNLRADSYTVRITDANGCQITTSGPPVSEPGPLAIAIDTAASYNGYNISCVNGSNGAIEVSSASGGTLNYTFILTGSSGVIETITSPTMEFTTGLPKGTYRVTIRDENYVFNGTCERISSPLVLIDPPGLFAGFLNLPEAVCYDTDPVAITEQSPAIGGLGAGTYTYQWYESTDGTLYNSISGETGISYDPPLSIAQIAQDAPYQRYYKREVNSGSCPTPAETSPVSITVNPLPRVTIDTTPDGPPAFICEGGTLVFQYEFAPGQAPYYFNFTQITYDADDNVISTIPQPERLAGTSTPIIIPQYSNKMEFVVTGIRDFYGCVGSDFPPNVVVDVGNADADFAVVSANPQCSGAEFLFEVNTRDNVAYTFTWPDGIAGPDPASINGTQVVPRNITVLNTGSITELPVILRAQNTDYACPPDLEVRYVRVYPAITPGLVITTPDVCSGTEIIVNNITLASAGSSHTFTVTDQLGNVIPSPVSQGPGPYSPTVSFTIDNTGLNNPETYTITYDIQNSAGFGDCTNQMTETVRVYRAVDAIISDPTTGSTYREWGDMSPPNPALEGDMVEISPGVFVMRISFTNASMPTPTGAPIADIEYEWTFSNNNSNTPPQTFTNDNPLVTYDFRNPGQNKRAILVVTNTAAEGVVVGGCTDRAELMFDIDIAPLIPAFTLKKYFLCLPDTIITENTSPPLVNRWTIQNLSLGGPPILSDEYEPKFFVSEPGRYRIFLEIRDPSYEPATYFKSDDQFVDVYLAPTAAFALSPYPKIFIPDQVLRTDNRSINSLDVIPEPDNFNPPIYYEWNFGDGRPGSILTSSVNPTMADPNFSPTYRYETEEAVDGVPVTLIAVNDHGNGAICRDTATMVIFPIAAGSTRIPNAFTPGGPNGGVVNPDGTTINDVFLPITKGVKEFQMQIFDRWGNLIFESRQQNKGWDGYDRNGNLLPAGVYVYKLVLRMANDQRTTQVGDVTLIR